MFNIELIINKMNKKSGNINIIKRLENFFKKNAQKFNVETAFLFGSQASGFPTKDSDIDIGIVFDNNKFSDEEIFFKTTDISNELSKIISGEVNIIPVYNDFRKPFLYYNVIVLGKPLYIENYDKYIVLRNEAMFQMEDFSIFEEKWMFETAKNKLRDIINA
jgi:predicted nucleotidyltransferase